MFSGGSPRSDGDLLFLTDSAYLSLLDQDRTFPNSSKGKQKEDGLFLERLDSFIESQLRDMEAFATREQRTLDEVRKLVAISHARFLFSQDPTLPSSSEDTMSLQTNSGTPSMRGVLSNLSNTLQVLHKTAGLDSLLLVVSPTSYPSPHNTLASNGSSSLHNDTFKSASEASWIGGTELGKEFWTGLKGGGVNGARAFRIKCQLRHEAELHEQELEENTPIASPAVSQLKASLADSAGTRSGKIKSSDVKTELNAAVRQALRLASGNPSAEMRWTKPASLEDLYQVRLVGWPHALEMRNPSNNTVKENRLLLDCVRNGRMKFVKKDSPEWNSAGSTVLAMNGSMSAGGLQQSNVSQPIDGGISQPSRILQADGVHMPTTSGTAVQSASVGPLTSQISTGPEIPVSDNSRGEIEAPGAELSKRRASDVVETETLEMQDRRKRPRHDGIGEG